MDSALLAAGLLAGCLLGASVAWWVAARRAARAAAPASAAEADSAPAPGPLARQTTQALEATRSAWLVVSGDDGVLAASASAAPLGLVRGRAVALEPVRRAVRSARGSGQLVVLEVEPRASRGAPAGPGMEARVAPLEGGLVVVVVDDRSEARRIAEVRRDFLANVSHELKTPVGALSLLAEAVVDASDDPEAVRRFAGRMQHESARLTTLVNELIDLSRLQGDDPLSHAEAIAVDDLVAAAVERGRLHAEAKAIALTTGGEAGLSVYGDRQQLATALSNLVDNAIHYSPDRTRVVLSTRAAGDDVEIAVTDQGIGIPEAELDRVFERFYRVDPARSRATGGTGLGLSIVKHICANHGGEVALWSVEGAGSTFTLRLPRHGEQADAAPEAQPPLSASGSAEPLREVAP